MAGVRARARRAPRALRRVARDAARSAPPPDTPLDVDRGPGGEVIVFDGETLVARARPADRSDVVPPVRPTVAQARQAMCNHPWLGERHFLSDCFVCGPGRDDGLGVHFGPLPGWPKLTAARLVADATLPHGPVCALAPELVWAALDCPSYSPRSGTHGRALLAALAAGPIEPVRLGEPVVAVGWPLETDGRRDRSASALLGAGTAGLLGRARALWIRLVA